jgi:hypothetical protein
MKTIHSKTTASILALLLFCTSFNMPGQNVEGNFLTISGIVKDSKTHDPVLFATINVSGTDIGTVTNSEGEFILKIGRSVKAEAFEISHISYVTRQFRINENIGSSKVLYLDPHVFHLKEIAIIPEDPKTIVKMALNRISVNYPDIPNEMTGFYRETIRQKHDYLSISEALVDIYKAPYSSYQNDQVKLIKGRNGSNVKKADTLMVQLQGGPSISLLLDIIKNRDLSIGLDNLDNYIFEQTGYVSINDQPNYVISFKPAVSLPTPLYIGKLYIQKESLAITMAEFSLDLSDPGKAAGMFIQKKPLGLLFVPTATSYLVKFDEQKGKFYLNYVRIELKFKCDWKKRWFKNNYSIISEVAITDRREDKINRFANQETFRSNMILADKIQSFSDVDYWGEYNIIEPEQSIENAIKKFRKSLKK